MRRPLSTAPMGEALQALRHQGLILTVKHQDGFCLWPSAYTDHCVSASKWKQGRGDVVAECAAACREFGIKFGVYLSIWDRHEETYGTSAYNDFFKNQLRELLTDYGDIFCVWLDSTGCGDPVRDHDMEAGSSSSVSFSRTP